MIMTTSTKMTKHDHASWANRHLSFVIRHSALSLAFLLAGTALAQTRQESLASFRARFDALRKSVQPRGAARRDLAVGVASSMEKVLPRDLPFTATVTNRFCLSLARNETESFQVLVAASQADLKPVRLRVGPLRSGGATLAPTNIQAAVMGYVQTRTNPPYGTPAVGWWPDPILNFLEVTPIASGDVQSFWMRVHSPKDQKPGLYKGRIQLLVDERPACAFDLEVRVHSFTLPDRSPLPLAVTFSPEENAIPSTQAEQSKWRQSPDYPVNAWRNHKLEWADFLANYYLTYDSLYHRAQPDFDILSHLHQQGKLGMFNLGYYDYPGPKPEDLDTWKQQQLPRLRQAYDRARQLGLLPHAYIYGCDEVTADFFPRVQQAALILKTEFPDALVMTTTYDQSYGQNSVLKSMDAFCPLTPSFAPDKAAAARAAGKQVWWYICCGPHHPHANNFIEYPAIEARLLMGAMTAKQRPDGFLYYQISIWNSQKPITFGPFTDWDPRSWTVYHGDGSWTCVGPGGTPLPTIRLENFRDGLEDFAYVRLLQAAIDKIEASPDLRAKKGEWLRSAQSLLRPPAGLVKSMTEYSREPAMLYSWRNQLAQAIESGGVEVNLE
jgi:hypothetical protein